MGWPTQRQIAISSRVDPVRVSSKGRSGSNLLGHLATISEDQDRTEFRRLRW